MTIRSIAGLLAATCLVVSASGGAALALFTLDELASRSKTIVVVRVLDVKQPGWKADPSGAAVALANIAVVRQLKGEVAPKAVVAYLVNVADQEQLEPGKLYLIFAFGAGPMFMGHQLRALPIAGEDVIVTGITGESSRQPFAAFEQRVRAAIKAK